MVHAIGRRAFLATSGGLCAFGLAGPSIGRDGTPVAPGAGHESAPSAGEYFPSHDPALAREIVGVSHRDIARVRELLAEAPDLAKATWDWGFGDWETALGAASHTGRREIALLLIEHGARIDIFAAAMLGYVDVVRSFIEAQPGIERTWGPHGISLMSHAEAGGDEALEVVDYLRGIPGADDGQESEPVGEATKELVGTYEFGRGDRDRFDVVFDKDQFWFTTTDGARRRMAHKGDHVFQPAGARGVRIRFVRAETGWIATIEAPKKMLDARRV